MKTLAERNAVLLRPWTPPLGHDEVVTDVDVLVDRESRGIFSTRYLVEKFKKSMEYVPIEPCINCSRAVQRVRGV